MAMLLKTLSLAFLSIVASAATKRSVTINNNCGYAVWFDIKTETGENTFDGTVNIGSGSSEKYDIPDKKWVGKFYAKTGCDESGTNCDSGESGSCPCAGCCLSPTQTTIRFSFQVIRRDPTITDDFIISLENGYNIPLSIKGTKTIFKSCAFAICNVTLDDCPTDEIYELGDLRVLKGDRAIQCLSPCTKMTLPQPNGQGKSISECTSRNQDLDETKYYEVTDAKCGDEVAKPDQPHYLERRCTSGSSFEVVICP